MATRIYVNSLIWNNYSIHVHVHVHIHVHIHVHVPGQGPVVLAKVGYQRASWGNRQRRLGREASRCTSSGSSPTCCATWRKFRSLPRVSGKRGGGEDISDWSRYDLEQFCLAHFKKWFKPFECCFLHEYCFQNQQQKSWCATWWGIVHSPPCYGRPLATWWALGGWSCWGPGTRGRYRTGRGREALWWCAGFLADSRWHWYVLVGSREICSTARWNRCDANELVS